MLEILAVPVLSPAIAIAIKVDSAGEARGPSDLRLLHHFTLYTFELYTFLQRLKSFQGSVEPSQAAADHVCHVHSLLVADLAVREEGRARSSRNRSGEYGHY